MLYKFTLTTNVVSGVATANVQMPNGDDARTGVPIYDLTGRYGDWLSGAEGWCTRVYDKFYFTDSTSGGSATCTFTLAGTLNASIGAFAAATVISTNYPGLSAGASIVVWNTGQYQAFAGATGMATLVGSTWWVDHVDQHCTLWTAYLNGDTHDFSPGGGGPGSVTDQKAFSYLNAGRNKLTGYPHGWMPTTPPNVQNPFNYRAVSGDRGLFGYCPQTGQTILLNVMPAVANVIEYKLSADRPNGRTATIAATVDGIPGFYDCGDFPEDSPESEFEVRDEFTVIPNAKSGQTGIAYWDWSLEKYVVLVGKHMATRVTADILSFPAGGGPTFTVNNCEGQDGTSPSGTVTVQNRYNWDKGTTGHPIEIAWDVVAGEWYPVQMECPD